MRIEWKVNGHSYHKINHIFSCKVSKYISQLSYTQMLSICDIVLNHTANESPFLVSHPECTYNCTNSPHLRPAYILDAVLFELTVQVASGAWEFKGIPTLVDTEDHLNVSHIPVIKT